MLITLRKSELITEEEYMAIKAQLMSDYGVVSDLMA